MSSTENKSENPSTQADGVKTGIVENKKSLEGLADQKVDGDNVLGGGFAIRDRNKTSGGGQGHTGGGG